MAALFALGLMSAAVALIFFYAPVDEDFGMVPYEAFLSEKPVVTTTDANGTVSQSTSTRSLPTIALTSDDFADNGTMPVELTCQGAQRMPALHWTGVPVDAVVSFELLSTIFMPQTPLHDGGVILRGGGTHGCRPKMVRF